jgi:hypothetical protein
MHCKSKLNKGICFGLLLFLAIATGCDDSAPTVAASVPMEISRPPISVATLDGRVDQVQADAHTDLVFMATWCPYSKQLKKAILDQRLSPYISRRKLKFLFSDNEWPNVEKELGGLVESGEITKQQIPAMMAKLKRRSGSAHVFDPKFLSDLPGNGYICKLPKEVDGFPMVMRQEGYKNRLEYLLSLNIPTELAVEVLSDYSPDKKTDGGN